MKELAFAYLMKQAYKSASLKEKAKAYYPIVSRILREENAPLSPEFVLGLMAVESGFNPAARSPAGAIGLMQVLPRTAQEVGIDPSQLSDPEVNIRAGIRYLKKLLEEYKIPSEHLPHAYYAGPDYPKKQQKAKEIEQYAKKVKSKTKEVAEELGTSPPTEHAALSPILLGIAGLPFVGLGAGVMRGAGAISRLSATHPELIASMRLRRLPLIFGLSVLPAIYFLTQKT